MLNAEQTKDIYGFDDRWLLLFGIPFMSFVGTLMIFGTEGLVNSNGSCYLICLLFTIAYWFSFRYLQKQYHKRYIGYEFTSGRVIYVVFWMFIMFFTVNLVIGSFCDYIFPNHQDFREGEVQTNLITITIIMLIFFIYEGIYYLNKSRVIELEKKQLEQITAEQKLSTLKNQVNPHFLFNSLNTLVTIIPEEPELAIEFVQQMSKTYRNILENRDEKLVTIEQELKGLDSYIYLLKTRFQGKIHIYNTIDESQFKNFILPLSLQILIENAVKHNITSKTKPLKIELTSNDTHIHIKNNLQKKNQQYNSTKMGLANIKSRYDLLADKEIIILETADEFIVSLPIIKSI